MLFYNVTCYFIMLRVILKCYMLFYNITCYFIILHVILKCYMLFYNVTCYGIIRSQNKMLFMGNF